MPSYDMTGTVKLVLDQQTFSSGFTKREFVLTTEGERFPQDVKFECVKDKISLLEGIAPGQRVTVSFDVRGNEYNGRYFVNLTAWRLQPAEGGGEGADTELPPLEALGEPEAGGGDNLPF